MKIELKSRWLSLFTTWVTKRLKLRKPYRFGRTIAISFYEHSLQLVTAANIWHKTKLLDVTKIYIPRSCDTEEKRRSFIFMEINKYIKRYGTRLTRYVLGVGSTDSAFRIISLPQMPKKEQANAIRWETDKRIPFAVENAYYGYHLSKGKGTTTADSVSVSLIAISKSEVDIRYNLLSPMKIKYDAVFYEIEALGHLLPYVDNYDDDKTYALINIRREQSEISYYHGKRLEFMNISPVGSKVLSDSKDDSKYEAFTKSLVAEIQTSLDYYIGQFANTSTDIVFVYGDLSYTDELINNLSNHLGIEFKRFPLDRLAESVICKEELLEQIPVSLSTVALAMIDHGLIDFLPPDAKEEKAESKYIGYAVPGFIVFIALLIAGWGMLEYKDAIKSAWLASSTAQIAKFENSQPVIMYSQIKRQMTTDKEILKTLNQDPTYLHLNLKELSRVTPNQIKLNMYDLEKAGRNKNLFISGWAASTDPPPEVVLAEFIVRLESSPFFENVTLEKHLKSTHIGNFKIDFQVSMDALL
jgi:Tfp pilus assembly PilM family ATPase